MDLIADVMNNASPAKVRTASRALEQLSREASNVSFAAHSGSRRNEGPPGTKRIAHGQAEAEAAGNHQNKVKRQAMLELETVLATKMVEAMMPKDQSRIYGDGTAGEVWRGMHIEVMGKALANKGLLSTTDDNALDLDTLPFAEQRAKKIVPFAG